MPREISAGGVVLRQLSGVWHVALIEPRKDEPGKDEPRKDEPREDESRKDELGGKISKPAGSKKAGKRDRAVLALPKGLVDSGEKPLDAAVREVLEETGLVAEPVIKLSDNKYVYVRTWGDGQRVFKIVSFYLMHYRSGKIDNLKSEMRVEVKQARWIPLAEAPRQMAYGNERKVVREAEEYLRNHAL